MKMKQLLRASTALATIAAFSAAQASGSGPASQPPSVTMIAGQRMSTPSYVVQNYANSSLDDSGISSPGPYVWYGTRKIHFGHLVGAGSYYQCGPVYANWAQGSGESVTTTGTFTLNSPVITGVASIARVMKTDMVAASSYVPSGTRVMSVSGDASKTIVMSQNASLAGSAVSVSFQSAPSAIASWATELESFGGPIVVTSSINVWGSTTQPQVFKFRGSEFGIVNPGDTLAADPLQGKFLPDTDYAVDTTVWWGPGTYIFGTHSSLAALNESYSRTGATNPPNGTTSDLTIQAAPSYTYNLDAYQYAPSSMLCSAYTPSIVQPSATIWGDSIPQSAQDGTTIAGTNYLQMHGDAAGNNGPYERALAILGWNYNNASQAAKRTADFNNHHEHVGAISYGASWIILAIGINDIAFGDTAATLEGRMQAMATAAVAAGGKPICTTVGTETSTTDGGVTTTNQTPASAFAVSGAGMTYNDYVRSTGAAAWCAGRLIDYADITMSARDSQKWRVDQGTPAADWFGNLMSLTFTAGTGQTNGSYSITFAGNGCTTQPVGTLTVAGGIGTAVTLTNKGQGCTSNGTATITGSGGTPSTLAPFIQPLRLGIHPLTYVDVTGTSVDFNTYVAAQIATQLAAAATNTN